MSHGVRVFDSAGGQVFNEQTLSLRVIAIAFISLSYRRSPITISVPEARDGHVAFIQSRNRYQLDGTAGIDGYRGFNPPYAFVGNGFVRLENINVAFNQTNPGSINGDFDIYVVELS